MKFTFPPGSRPLEGYTLKRGIARGGFGEVYYGLSDAGKEVAIKLLQQNMEVELRGVQHCLNLRHPHLVAIYDVKTDADHDHWVIMEYIAGDTLEQILLKQRGPLPLDQIESWMKGTESGLAYLHDRGIVHRDVKPGNIFWDDGAIKIGDVGLSKFMTPSRRSAHTESVGTVYYMAPEVTYGKYGYEVDIYSCGVMLYEMLTGRLPFDGQSTGEILMKHLSERPDLTIVPIAFRSVLEGALQKDPKTRTPSITQLFHEFEAALHGRPFPSRETRPRDATPTGFAAASVPLEASVRANASPAPLPPGSPSRLAEPYGATYATAPFPFAETTMEATPTPANQQPRPREEHTQAAETDWWQPRPLWKMSFSEEDLPTWNWWLPRIIQMVGLLWVALQLVNPPARIGEAIFIMWPLIFVCLRYEPVRGSGLSWLWHRPQVGTTTTAYSGEWWARRLSILGFVSLSIFAADRMFNAFSGTIENESWFPVLVTFGVATYLSRLSEREHLGISIGDRTKTGLFTWQIRDHAELIVERLQRWDRTMFGFWIQRIGIYFWLQCMLFFIVASQRGGAGPEFGLIMTILFFPFILISWMLIRPDMNPFRLRNWIKFNAPLAAQQLVRPGPGSRPAVGPVVTPAATFQQSKVPSQPQSNRSRAVGLTLTPQTARRISGRQRLFDLTVSMTWAVILTLLFAVATGFLSPLFGVPSSLKPDQGKLGLFTITTLLAAWSLLVSAKLTEGSTLSGRSRRVFSMGLGLGVGACAWWLNHALMVGLSSQHLRQQAAFSTLGRQPLLIDNAPTMLSFMLFFGLLFGLRCWWCHADAFRPAVFQIGSVILTVAVASILPVIFAFPWDWAITWAAVISCVVQLSAVWTPPENRNIAG
jgi:serine/threonine protein kinase